MSTVLTATPAALPRELVLASAGTGKTFRISSRIIGLLAAGSSPDAIFASTFTRKAAGEILDRVLARLAEAALDPGAAEELAKHAGLEAGVPIDPTPDGWLRLLRRVLSELHRLNISTLDAFFIRTASSFADDLALPPGWTIADTPMTERLRAEALHAVLDQADTGELIELLRGLEAKDAARSVHDALLRRAEELLDLHHALDTEASDAWKGLAAWTRGVPADPDAIGMQLAEAFEAAEPPRNKNGTPKKSWERALRSTAELLRASDWESLISSTLFQNARRDEKTYDRVEIPDEILALIEEACELARYVIARRISLQSQAMGRLAEHLAAAVDRTQRELGAFGFGDVTRLLGGPDALCERPDLYYRLDARVQHILLDEFQDTSLAQWEALEPLLDELLSGYEGERAAVVVADPKQSIYAWRGGEPLLVQHVGNQYVLNADELSRSWRSSQVVLDAVNEVFERIEENPIFEGEPVAQAVAADWKRAFVSHTAAKDLPGYVRLLAGPHDEGRGEDSPLLCRRAAELVAELRAEAPGRSIGVLTRKNKTVARIMLELRNLGIHASEEGGNPLTDSPAVSAVLALFRLADHPGDRIARYHVANTPVAEVVGLRTHDDDVAARTLAHTVRRQLLDDGYGRTLTEIVRGISGGCEARDQRRLAQLVELGFRYDARSTLRPSDFVRLVEAERVEDPTAADVRVMTVHQSKGLEFDIVVLPELDVQFSRSRPDPLAYRPHPTGRATRVFPYVGKATRDLFPDAQELHEAAEQAEAARCRDALSGLYVALTRARHALHILVKPDRIDKNGKPKPSTANTAARLVRAALAPDELAVEGAVLYESGDPFWVQSIRDDPSAEDTLLEVVPDSSEKAGAESVILRTSSRKRKALTQVSPSAMAGGSRVDLRSLLRLDMHAAEQGRLAHAWMEQIGWIEDGVPTDEELWAVARSIAPALPEEVVENLRIRFRTWLGTPDIRYQLSRGAYPAGATVEREVPFLHRRDGHLVEGIIDRLVVLREEDRVVGAEILDYKTDGISKGDPAALAAKADHYRPQLDAYRAAVADGYRISREKVAARLLFLDVAAILELK